MCESERPSLCFVTLRGLGSQIYAYNRGGERGLSVFRGSHAAPLATSILSCTIVSCFTAIIRNHYHLPTRTQHHFRLSLQLLGP